MKSTQNQGNIRGLDIHLVSFTLPPSLVKNGDDIRVSITTLPNQQKQYFIVKAKNMDDINFDFTVNITPATEKIIVVFRKKSFLLNDPIIASTIIRREDFPSTAFKEDDQETSSIRTEVKVMNIFEPIQKNRTSEKANKRGLHEFNPSVPNRKNRLIIGQMQLQMSLSNPYSLQDIHHISHHVKCKKNSHSHREFKKGPHLRSSENRNDYQLIA